MKEISDEDVPEDVPEEPTVKYQISGRNDHE